MYAADGILTLGGGALLPDGGRPRALPPWATLLPAAGFRLFHDSREQAARVPPSRGHEPSQSSGPSIAPRNRCRKERRPQRAASRPDTGYCTELACYLATGELADAIAEDLGLSRRTVCIREKRGALVRMEKGHGLTVSRAPIPVAPQPG